MYSHNISIHTAAISTRRVFCDPLRTRHISYGRVTLRVCESDIEVNDAPKDGYKELILSFRAFRFALSARTVDYNEIAMSSKYTEVPNQQPRESSYKIPTTHYRPTALAWYGEATDDEGRDLKLNSHLLVRAIHPEIPPHNGRTEPPLEYSWRLKVLLWLVDVLRC